MCVRTKISYGCGCEYKETNECHSSRCAGLERYQLLKDGDCQNCKSGGDTVTRGREGKGRYGKQMNQRDPLREVSHNASLNVDVSGGASPWKRSTSRTRDEWHSPTRKQADIAWEKEHEARIEELSERAEKLSVAPPRRASSPRPIPRRRSTKDCYESDHYRSREHDYEHRYRKRSPSKLTVEVRTTRDGYPSHKYDSQDGLDRVPRLESLSKSYKHYHPDPYDSGYGSGSYGSYDSRRSHGHRGARTEPYIYSPVSYRTTYEVPISASPYGYPPGSYGVEIYPRRRY